MSHPEQPSANLFHAIIFDKISWGIIKDDVLQLAKDNFRLTDETEPVLGVIVDGTDAIAYPTLENAFCDQGTTVVLLQDPSQDNKIIGYSWAMPIDKMDPRRTDGSTTAYIYQTVIAEPYRRKKLVAEVVDPLFRELDRKGFTTAERDARVENGYADNVSKQFAGTFLEEPYDHNPFGIGKERHFRIDIKKYLEKFTG